MMMMKMKMKKLTGHVFFSLSVEVQQWIPLVKRAEGSGYSTSTLLLGVAFRESF